MCRYRSFRWVPQIPATLQAILSYRYLHFVIPPRSPHVFSGRSRSRVTVTTIVARRFMRTALINFFNKPKSEMELTQKDQRYRQDFVAQFSRLFLKTPTPSLSLSFWFSSEQKYKTKKLLHIKLVSAKRPVYEYTWCRSQHCGLLLLPLFLCIRVACTFSTCSTFSQEVSRFFSLDSVKQRSLAGELVSTPANWSVWQMTINKRLRNLEKFSHHCMFFWANLGVDLALNLAKYNSWCNCWCNSCIVYQHKTKDVLRKGPFNINLSLFVCFFDVYQAS